MKRLTTKQRKFSDNYIKCGNATQSAIKAGYSKRSARQIANRLMSKDDIKHYIKSKLDNMSKQTIAGANEILKYYTSVLRGNASEDVVIGTPTGEIKDKKRPDIRERTEAAKELMKRYTPIERAKQEKLKAEAIIAKSEAKSTIPPDVKKHDTMLDAFKRGLDIQHTIQSTKKLKAETKLKEFVADHLDNNSSDTTTKLNELLDAVFQDNNKSEQKQ